MRPFKTRWPIATAETDRPLSEAEHSALQQACLPVGLLSFPPVEVIRTLRQAGYVEIVLGGVQITPRGLERLLIERRRRQHADPD